MVFGIRIGIFVFVLQMVSKTKVMIKILLVEDNHVVRASMAVLLKWKEILRSLPKQKMDKWHWIY